MGLCVPLSIPLFYFSLIVQRCTKSATRVTNKLIDNFASAHAKASAVKLKNDIHMYFYRS